MYTFYIYRRSFVHKKGEKDIRNPDDYVKGIFPSSRWLKAVAQRTTSRFAIKQFRKYCVDGDFDTEVFHIIISVVATSVLSICFRVRIELCVVLFFVQYHDSHVVSLA